MELTGFYVPDPRQVARVVRRVNRGRRWVRLLGGLGLSVFAVAAIHVGRVYAPSGPVEWGVLAAGAVAGAVGITHVAIWWALEREMGAFARAGEFGARIISVTTVGISVRTPDRLIEAPWETIGPIREVAGVWLVPFPGEETRVIVPPSAFVPGDAATLRTMLEARATASKA
ncbi:hypothetical protein Afil01_38020 [Actinorhabdospora filicis]|uniref:YcxB-like protein n=1 Tax=Actinorhabdospora filicis TaxID=1785913 RepID=A0A9W6WBR8_9ACTN|nr:hypothetical protein [Actinorhabdospora filicis]GLZ78995.1 hypothetical protein Afil01_38020 [Actinorhabdospora filicis]